MSPRFPLATAALLLIASQASAKLIAFYPFNDNANDAGPSALHGSVQGATPTATGYEGGAYSFNGTNTSINLPVNINPAATPQLTMGAWVNASTISNVRQILSHDDGGYDRSICEDVRGGGGLTWSAFTGSGVLAGPRPATTNEWVFLAAVYDNATGLIRMHVNDAYVTGFGRPGSGVSSTAVGKNPQGSLNGEFFAGLVDNVFFFDEVLSPAQLESIRVGGAAAIAQTFLPGDANLDGRIDPDDFALLDRGRAQSLTGWTNGDFNADGTINSADYLIIDTAYLQSKAQGSQSLGSSFLAQREAQFGPAYVSQLLTALPEPATLSLLTLTPLLLSTRRRHRS